MAADAMATDPRVFLKLVVTLYSIPNALERLLAFDHWQPELDEDLRGLADVLADHIGQIQALPDCLQQWQRSEQLIRATLARRAIRRITG